MFPNHSRRSGVCGSGGSNYKQNTAKSNQLASFVSSAAPSTTATTTASSSSLLHRNKQQQRKREIRRRIRDYEATFQKNSSNNSNFLLMEMENDLMRACSQTRNDPHEVVLLVYTMARISMMTTITTTPTPRTETTQMAPEQFHSKDEKATMTTEPDSQTGSTRTTASTNDVNANQCPVDLFPLFHSAMLRSTRQEHSPPANASSAPSVATTRKREESLMFSLPERFGYLLWNSRNCCGIVSSTHDDDDDDIDGEEDDDTPLQWAMEAAAKKVVQFVVAWHIVWLMDQLSDPSAQPASDVATTVPKYSMTETNGANECSAETCSSPSPHDSSRGKTPSSTAAAAVSSSSSSTTNHKTKKQCVLDWWDQLSASAAAGTTGCSNRHSRNFRSLYDGNRESLSHYRSLTQVKFSLVGLVSFFVLPYLVGYPALQQYVNAALKRFEQYQQRQLQEQLLRKQEQEQRQAGLSSNHHHHPDTHLLSTMSFSSNMSSDETVSHRIHQDNQKQTCSVYQQWNGDDGDDEFNDDSYSFCADDNSDNDEDDDDDETFTLVGPYDTNDPYDCRSDYYQPLTEYTDYYSTSIRMVVDEEDDGGNPTSWEVVSVDSCHSNTHYSDDEDGGL